MTDPTEGDGAATPIPDAPAPPEAPPLDALTPRQIVAELDKYVVGQADAKRAVAVALRNRWRRLRAPEAIRDEIVPANILMIGPTGVGKTEIARRLAQLAGAPFVKVEATKFTEVGYVGRDVESMIRDLVDGAVAQARDAQAERAREAAEALAEERLLDLLLPPTPRTAPGTPTFGFPSAQAPADDAPESRTREKLRDEAPRGRARRPRGRGRRHVRPRRPTSRSSARWAWRRWASTSTTCSAAWARRARRAA